MKTLCFDRVAKKISYTVGTKLPFDFLFEKILVFMFLHLACQNVPVDFNYCKITSSSYVAILMYKFKCSSAFDNSHGTLKHVFHD